jgi:glycosyltransferase involved in cell wall biosynthesis
MKNEIKDVTIVMPLYNEEKIIKDYLNDWIKILNELQINWSIEIYNDGSTDCSTDIIKEFFNQYPDIILHNREHKGFSKTLYEAYKNTNNTNYVFHSDSDNELSPQFFKILWNERNNADLIIGRRINRKQSLKRFIATYFASIIISFLFSKSKKILVHDTNVPFRLLKHQLLNNILNTIDENYPYPNLFMVAYCLKNKLNICEIDTEHNKNNSYSTLNNTLRLIKEEIVSFVYLIIYYFKLNKQNRINS